MVEIFIDLLQQMVVYWMMDLFDLVDWVIIIWLLVYLIQYFKKVVWFIYYFCMYYDMWDIFYCGFFDDVCYCVLCGVLVWVDIMVLVELYCLFINLQVVVDWVKCYNGLNVEVLYLLLFDVLYFCNDQQGDEIVYICWMEYYKCQYLLLEVFKYVIMLVKLCLCGISSGLGYINGLCVFIVVEGLQDCVVCVDCWIIEEEKVQWLFIVLVVVYLLEDEDFYGYFLLEVV